MRKLTEERSFKTLCPKSSQMKTKKYEFTEDEMIAIRNALIEYYHFLKDTTGKLENNRWLRMTKNLKEQFKDDCSKI
uniref:Uncharacterized protein n=1 Tax=viral metagenome TaxID=1070528 RepID=A0A6M3LKL0_9ZZZZ